MPSPIQTKSRHQPHTLVFEAMDERRGKENWRSVDVDWHDPSDAWQIAHDLYHHHPTDTGTLSEEVLTFGVEEYLEREGVILDYLTRNQDELADVIMFVLDASWPHWDLPAVPKIDLSSFPDTWVQAWGWGWDEALTQIKQAIKRKPKHTRWKNLPNLSQKDLKPLHSPELRQRFIHWCAQGWNFGQKRYPHAEQVSEHFYALMSEIEDLTEKERPAGTRLEIKIKRDRSYTLKRIPAPQLEMEHKTPPVPKKKRQRVQ